MNAYWNDNLDLSHEEVIFKIVRKSRNRSRAFFFDGIKNRSSKDELKKFTNDAFDKEVFGAPTFIVNNKIFWGQDRLEYAIEELS